MGKRKKKDKKTQGGKGRVKAFFGHPMVQEVIDDLIAAALIAAAAKLREMPEAKKAARKVKKETVNLADKAGEVVAGTRRGAKDGRRR